MMGRPAAWRRWAACRGESPDLFFPDPSDRATEAKALALCAGCVVREPCRAYALQAREPLGIWGGVNEGRLRRPDRPAPKLRRRPAPGPCECGCGGQTKGGWFLPGHDGHLKSRLLRAAKAGDHDARAELEARGWWRAA